MHGWRVQQPCVVMSLALIETLTSNEVAPSLIRVSMTEFTPSSTVYDCELHRKLTAAGEGVAYCNLHFYIAVSEVISVYIYMYIIVSESISTYVHSWLVEL